MSSSAPAIDTSDMDPELARYLNRNYWQQRSEQGTAPAATTPSAPVATTEPKTSIVKTHEIVSYIFFFFHYYITFYFFIYSIFFLYFLFS